MSGKVTFEFNENEDLYDINLIVNRHKLANSLREISDYRRNIYKGYINNTIYVKGNHVVTDEEFKEAQKEPPYYMEGGKTYIPLEDVENELTKLLQDWWNIDES